MIYIFINRVMNRMRTSDPSEQNMQNDIEMYQTILKMICKKCFQNIDSELQLPNKIFSKDIELENRRIGLPEVIDSVSSFPWKTEKAEIIVDSKSKVLFLFQKIALIMFLIRWLKRGKFAQDVIGPFPAFNQTPVDMGRHALRWKYKRMQNKNTKKREKNTKPSTKHLNGETCSQV